MKHTRNNNEHILLYLFHFLLEREILKSAKIITLFYIIAMSILVGDIVHVVVYKVKHSDLQCI